MIYISYLGFIFLLSLFPCSIEAKTCSNLGRRCEGGTPLIPVLECTGGVSNDSWLDNVFEEQAAIHTQSSKFSSRSKKSPLTSGGRAASETDTAALSSSFPPLGTLVSEHFSLGEFDAILQTTLSLEKFSQLQERVENELCTEERCGYEALLLASLTSMDGQGTNSSTFCPIQCLPISEWNEYQRLRVEFLNSNRQSREKVKGTNNGDSTPSAANYPPCYESSHKRFVEWFALSGKEALKEKKRKHSQSKESVEDAMASREVIRDNEEEDNNKEEYDDAAESEEMHTHDGSPGRGTVAASSSSTRTDWSGVFETFRRSLLDPKMATDALQREEQSVVRKLKERQQGRGGSSEDVTAQRLLDRIKRKPQRMRNLQKQRRAEWEARETEIRLALEKADEAAALAEEASQSDLLRRDPYNQALSSLSSQTQADANKAADDKENRRMRAKDRREALMEQQWRLDEGYVDFLSYFGSRLGATISGADADVVIQGSHVNELGIAETAVVDTTTATVAAPNNQYYDLGTSVSSVLDSAASEALAEQLQAMHVDRVAMSAARQLAHITGKTLFLKDADGRHRFLRFIALYVKYHVFYGAMDVGLSLYYTPPPDVAAQLVTIDAQQRIPSSSHDASNPPIGGVSTSTSPTGTTVDAVKRYSSVIPHFDTMDVVAIHVTGAKGSEGCKIDERTQDGEVEAAGGKRLFCNRPAAKVWTLQQSGAQWHLPLEETPTGYVVEEGGGAPQAKNHHHQQRQQKGQKMSGGSHNPDFPEVSGGLRPRRDFPTGAQKESSRTTTKDELRGQEHSGTSSTLFFPMQTSSSSTTTPAMTNGPTSMEAVLARPGDALYIPRGMIHATKTIATTMQTENGSKSIDAAAAAAAASGVPQGQSSGSSLDVALDGALHMSIGAEPRGSVSTTTYATLIRQHMMHGYFSTPMRSSVAGNVHSSSASGGSASVFPSVFFSEQDGTVCEPVQDDALGDPALSLASTTGPLDAALVLPSMLPFDTDPFIDLQNIDNPVRSTTDEEQQVSISCITSNDEQELAGTLAMGGKQPPAALNQKEKDQPAEPSKQSERFPGSRSIRPCKKDSFSRTYQKKGAEMKAGSSLTSSQPSFAFPTACLSDAAFAVAVVEALAASPDLKDLRRAVVLPLVNDFCDEERIRVLGPVRRHESILRSVNESLTFLLADPRHWKKFLIQKVLTTKRLIASVDAWFPSTIFSEQHTFPVLSKNGQEALDKQPVASTGIQKELRRALRNWRLLKKNILRDRELCKMNPFEVIEFVAGDDHVDATLFERAASLIPPMDSAPPPCELTSQVENDADDRCGSGVAITPSSSGTDGLLSVKTISGFKTAFLAYLTSPVVMNATLGRILTSVEALLTEAETFRLFSSETHESHLSVENHLGDRRVTTHVDRSLSSRPLFTSSWLRHHARLVFRSRAAMPLWLDLNTMFRCSRPMDVESIFDNLHRP